MSSDPKDDLLRYLQQGRDALVWKTEQLSEYDAHRPLVPTGTNLLGLVKHLTGVELVYFGTTFGRPSPDEPPFDENDPLADMFATADESRADIIAAYQRAWAYADATIGELPLDAIGHVPHWPAPHDEVTLHRMLTHVIADSQRHAGQADIIRELIDGAVGKNVNSTNMPDEVSWTEHWDRVEQAARDAKLPQCRMAANRSAGWSATTVHAPGSTSV
jgi:uncharacterized damage-inducible protein DinB